MKVDSLVWLFDNNFTSQCEHLLDLRKLVFIRNLVVESERNYLFVSVFCVHSKSRFLGYIRDYLKSDFGVFLNDTRP